MHFSKDVHAVVHYVFWVMIVIAAIGIFYGDCKQACAATSNCELIRDKDRRNMCRAVTKNDVTYCEFIKDHDMRHECRARVKK